jgi:hypothetical protein
MNCFGCYGEASQRRAPDRVRRALTREAPVKQSPGAAGRAGRRASLPLFDKLKSGSRFV